MQEEKLAPEWGIAQAARLLRKFDTELASFKGGRHLDFGCSWGYLCAAAIDEGALSSDGVDVIPHWNNVPGWKDRLDGRIGLHLGELGRIPEIEGRSFDIITSFGTLFLLDSVALDNTLSWMARHLSPQGVAVLSTRTVAAKSFNDLDNTLSVPGAQLLYARRVVNSHLRKKGVTAPKNHLAYTGSTFILACRSAGFEILKVQRGSNRDATAEYEKHEPKLRHLHPQELATGEIMVYLKAATGSPVDQFRKS